MRWHVLASMLVVALSVALCGGCEGEELPAPHKFFDQDRCPGLDCDDNNPCTKDNCDPQQGCLHEDNGGPCDDGNACTKNDSCQGASCQGQNQDCPDSDQCRQPDGCDSKTGCIYNNRAGPCSDGDYCNGQDACKDGECQPSGGPAKCNDNNDCTTDSCEKTKGCLHDHNTAMCEDGNECTQNDACSKGNCKGGKISCDDGNVCTNDECDGAKCGHEPADNDGQKCATNKACYKGKCAALIKGMRLIGAVQQAEIGCVNGDTQCQAHENPLHTVTLSAFLVDETEVTVAKYKTCVDAKGCTAPAATCSAGDGGTWGVAGKEDHPVNCVTWAQATAYCAWRMPKGGRLPTEAEWEYLQRDKKKGLIYPWGNNAAPPAKIGNLPDTTAEAANASWQTIAGYTDGHVYTAPVSYGAANAFGLKGMYGNVWEWVHDFYSANYYSQSNGAKDPAGPGSGAQHVTRGPGFYWTDGGVALRTSYRLHMSLTHAKNDLGFRCVKPYP